MKKWKLFPLLLCLLLAAALAGYAESGQDGEAFRDNTSVTTAVIAGETIEYTATAGTMALSSDLGKYELFYVAYTKDGEEAASRPVTFAFNGGPGSATMWLHMGLLGPMRVCVDEEGRMPALPLGYEPNENSILDMTDLVFVNPVGTGYSRAVQGTDPKAFYSYSHDIQSVGDFIRMYVSRNARWASPKYLAGESYGTTRAAGLCRYLSDQCAMSLNGIMMISSANDMASLDFDDGNFLPYAVFFPTYAASAWYHGKLDQELQEMSLEAFLEEVRTFVDRRYLPALFQGSRLSQEEKEEMAQQLGRYSGLKAEYWLKNNLRVIMEDFGVQLLSDERKMIGRIDTRYTGPLLGGDYGTGVSDPSFYGFTQAFCAADSDYISRELKYHTDEPYIAISRELGESWDSGELGGKTLSQEPILNEELSQNPFLKIWVLCGYYDMATPFYAAEYTYSQIFADQDRMDNVSFTYYPSGHMFYIHKPSMLKFREEAEAWFGK